MSRPFRLTRAWTDCRIDRGDKRPERPEILALLKEGAERGNKPAHPPPSTFFRGANLAHWKKDGERHNEDSVSALSQPFPERPEQSLRKSDHPARVLSVVMKQ